MKNVQIMFVIEKNIPAQLVRKLLKLFVRNDEIVEKLLERESISVLKSIFDKTHSKLFSIKEGNHNQCIQSKI
jgi:hypothetical protein